jgi:hypothetical protein
MTVFIIQWRKLSINAYKNLSFPYFADYFKQTLEKVEWKLNYFHALQL